MMEEMMKACCGLEGKPDFEKMKVSVEAEHRTALPETSWLGVHEPGAYVEEGSGDLYRIPKEALIDGGSPIIIKESRGASRLRQVSNDPFVTTQLPTCSTGWRKLRRLRQ